jgi:hypothetical protein
MTCTSLVQTYEFLCGKFRIPHEFLEDYGNEIILDMMVQESYNERTTVQKFDDDTEFKKVVAEDFVKVPTAMLVKKLIKGDDTTRLQALNVLRNEFYKKKDWEILKIAREVTNSSFIINMGPLFLREFIAQYITKTYEKRLI